MKNTIQLYTDDSKTVKGYPITSPDRVLYGDGKSIKDKLKKTVKFDVVGEGDTIPPIEGELDKIKESVESINEQLDAIDNVLSNYKVANVKDFGAIGNGVIDDTIAIQKAIDSLKNITCLTKSYETGMPMKRAIYGGGRLLFPSGVYKISSQLNLTPLIEVVGEGNVIIEVDKTIQTIESVFKLGDMVSKYNLFDVNGNNFHNLVILCNRKAKNGINLLRTISNSLTNVHVYGAYEDGIVLTTCQWTELSNVEVHGSGRHGFVIQDETENKTYLPSNNISMIRCQANKNGQRVEGHGIYIRSSNVSMTNCTSGHNGARIEDGYRFTDRKNCGIYITGTMSKFCSFIGGHLEQNYYHVLADGGYSFKLDSVYFVTDTEQLPKRFVVNNGCENLMVINCGSQTGTVFGEGGIDCPYEVNLGQFDRPALFVIGGNAKSTTKDIICYRDSNNELKVLNMKNKLHGSRCGVIGLNYDGLTMSGLQFKDPNDSSFGINYLRLGGAFYWDYEGKLYSRYGRVPANSTDGKIIGS